MTIRDHKFRSPAIRCAYAVSTSKRCEDGIRTGEKVDAINVIDSSGVRFQLFREDIDAMMESFLRMEDNRRNR